MLPVDETERGEANTESKDPAVDTKVKNPSLRGRLYPGDFTCVDTAVGDNTDWKEAIDQGDKESISAFKI